MPRLPFTFPFFEDELYYSWLARYHRRSGNRIPEYTLEQIFGYSPNCRPDRVCLINQFCEATRFDPNEIIEDHTTLPYYRPSYTEEKYRQLVLRVREQEEARYPHFTTEDREHSLKYCPICAQNEMEMYGLPYWHVSHNLDGITICPRHHVRLQSVRAPKNSACILPPSQSDELSVVENDQDELRFNELIQNCWRTEEYSKKEILVLLRILSQSQCQTGRHFQWLTREVKNDPTVQKLLENRQISSSRLTPLIDRLLQEPYRIFHPFYIYLIREFLGLTRETAEKIVSVYPGVFDSIR